MTKKGVIKRIIKNRYGFIKYSDGEIFFHINQVEKGKPAKDLEVSFTIGRGKKGPEARNVRIIEDIYEGYLPKDTAELIDYNKIDNFSLKLNKVVQPDGDKFGLFVTDRGRVKFWVNPDLSHIRYREIAKRQESIVQGLGLELMTIEYIPDWRLVVGLGISSVYETSMTLHHVWGIPYLPGSALKGVTRNWVISENFRHNEELALKNLDFCNVFGSPKDSCTGEQKGKVIFFDALPVLMPVIEADIMNPHYSEYYSDKKGEVPPADYENPIPIPFLTVKEGNFKVYIGARKNDEDYLKLANEWLMQALKEHGIGAKTAVGYGYNKV